MHIFSNLAISLDGKIASAKRGHEPLGTPADRRQMQVVRKKADAILMGADSLRAYRKPCLVNDKKAQPLNLVLSSRLDDVSPSWPFFKENKTERILFVSKNPPAARRKRFEKTSEIVLLNPKKSLSTQIVDNLKHRGLQSLLVEGGGGVMWQFVKHGLIKEFHVTLTPKIVGGSSAPTLVDGEGFSANHFQKLRLKSSRRLGNELYLVYTK